MSELIRLELKYCERCGGLLLRRAGLNLNLCRACQRIECDLPPVKLPARADRDQHGNVLPFRPASVRLAGHGPDLHACCEGEQA